jgi:hypothetical protein
VDLTVLLDDEILRLIRDQAYVLQRIAVDQEQVRKRFIKLLVSLLVLTFANGASAR